MYPDSRTRAAVGLGVLALGTSLAACASQTDASSTPADDSGAPSASSPATPEPTTTTSTPPAPDVAPAVYVDGEYDATGWYGGLPSHQDVTLTVDDNMVAGVQITTPAEDETSLGYQQRFADALPSAIVGRSLGEISVDRLAGSSGCSEGFMDTLAKIKTQAAA